MRNLIPHKSNTDKKSLVRCEYHFSPGFINIIIEVQTHRLYFNPKFSKEHCNNNGLWDYDVTEVFIQKGFGHGRYIELQISPLGQVYALLVERPREDVKEIKSFELMSSRFKSVHSENSFKTTFDVAVSDIPGVGDKLFGNFFCCLGPTEERNYFALNINHEEKADFHKPELFEELGQIL